MNFKFLIKGLAICTVMLTLSCSDDDDTIIPQPAISSFTVTIENVIEAKDYFNSGATGLITPGMSESYSFNAGKGHYLSFATMFVQSNDLFYAPTENGVALYNEDGTALNGDITSMIDLWDAGTEENEEPGVGDNQPPRQGDPNTGTDENGTVALISDITDGFTYPADEDIIKVTIEHDGGSLFTVTIANISDTATLPTPLAPGVWVINGAEQTPIFKVGEASSEGLEDIAEDGINTILNDELTASSGFVSPFAPGAFGPKDAIFTSGQTSSAALESLSEDGNPSGFPSVFNTPVGASEPGPILPGGSYSFEFTAIEGEILSFATMLVHSNDWFVGTNEIILFPNGIPISGDITSMVKLYDGGTEVDEYAGAGNNQPARQGPPNTGEDEGGVVGTENSAGDHVPAVAELVKVTITAN